MKDILIINDFVSKGKIAGNMMTAVLSYKNYNTYFIPSALISNSFSFGRLASANTNSYLEEALSVYTDIGFRFDAIFIGYIGDCNGLKIIRDFIDSLSYRPMILLDPIMGDNGKLYKSITDEKLAIYKKALKLADIILPNYTEAKFLGIDDFESLLGSEKKYVVTSVNDAGDFYNLGISDKLHRASFEKLSIKMSGTGDLFDALFLHYYLDTDDFSLAIDSSVRVIDKIIRKHMKTHPNEVDIYIESYLDLID